MSDVCLWAYYGKPDCNTLYVCAGALSNTHIPVNFSPAFPAGPYLGHNRVYWMFLCAESLSWFRLWGDVKDISQVYDVLLTKQSINEESESHY